MLQAAKGLLKFNGAARIAVRAISNKRSKTSTFSDARSRSLVGTTVTARCLSSSTRNFQSNTNQDAKKTTEDVLSALSRMTEEDGKQIVTAIRGLKNSQLNSIGAYEIPELVRRFLEKEKQRREKESAENKARSDMLKEYLSTVQEEPKTQEISRWSIYPDLHPLVLDQLPEEARTRVAFHDIDTDAGTKEHRDTFVMGSFRCTGSDCRKRWTSKKIGIRIRKYEGNKYNAPVYHQRCIECGNMGKIKIDKNVYAERVVYWLKKWLGYEVKKPTQRRPDNKKPHDGEHCEGCKLGRCAKSLD